MRKISSSREVRERASLVQLRAALARSRPNGFSTISRVQPATRRAAGRARSTMRRDRARRHGEVVDAVAARCRARRRAPSSTLHDRVLAVLAREVGGDVAHARGEPSQTSSSERVAAELAAPPPSSARRNSASVCASCGRRRRSRSCSGSSVADGERVERRDQLALGQVAGGAEDDERARARACAAGAGPRGGDSRRPRSQLPEAYARDRPAALLQRRVVACRLREQEPPEAELAARDRQLLAIVDDLEEAADRRPALVQLPGRVQVPRAEPEGDDAAGLLTGTRDERPQALLLGRVDEGLDRDVVARAAPGPVAPPLTTPVR